MEVGARRGAHFQQGYSLINEKEVALTLPVDCQPRYCFGIRSTTHKIYQVTGLKGKLNKKEGV